MATLTKSIRNTRKAKELSHYRLLLERDCETVSAEALKGIISYLKYLYSEGEISDKAYRSLVSQALSIFVENTINLKVERVFDEVNATLQESSKVILNNILT